MRFYYGSLVLLFSLSACGGSEEVTYSGDIWPLLESRCIVCHDTAGKMYYDSKVLFMNASETYEVLLNGAVSEDTIGGYTKYVVPGDAANSSLYDKIANDPPNSGGSVMPGSGMMLNTSDIELVESWIAAGALNN